MPLSGDYKKRYEEIFREFMEEEECGHFDEAALPSYTHSNRLMSFLFWKRIETALMLAGDLKKRSVLDFGCGGGVAFAHFKENECKITGCENQYCRITEKVCDALGIKAVIVRDLFGINDRYDKIFALDVLEHIGDLAGYLKKLTNLLNDKGQLIVSGPTENFLYKIGRRLAGFSGHYHLGNIYQIEDALREKGFKRIKVKLLYFPVVLFRISLWELVKQEGG